MFEAAYDELRRLAGGALSRLAPGGTLQPTALVHEAWLKLGDDVGERTRGREHFLALAALAMRQILVDAARRRSAERRGGDARRVTLVDGLDGDDASDQRALDVLDLHAALEDLATAAPRPARLVELRFFGGLDVKEAAAVLGVGETTAAMDWRFARAWLADKLQRSAGDG